MIKMMKSWIYHIPYSNEVNGMSMVWYHVEKYGEPFQSYWAMKSWYEWYHVEKYDEPFSSMLWYWYHVENMAKLSQSYWDVYDETSQILLSMVLAHLV